MIEKKIRGFYNSVQLSGDMSKAHAAKLRLLCTAAEIALGILAAAACAGAVMRVLEAAGDACRRVEAEED